MESIKEVWNRLVETFNDFRTAIVNAVNKILRKNSKQQGHQEISKPTNIEEFLKQKKNNQPFYKSAHNSKPWE